MKEQYTLHHAAQVFGFGYKILYGGEIYRMHSLTPTTIRAKIDSRDKGLALIPFEKFGKSAFILARPLSDLTVDIPGIGVPIVELAKMFSLFDLGECSFEIDYIEEQELWYVNCQDKNGRVIESICFDGNIVQKMCGDGTVFEPVNPHDKAIDKLKEWNFEISLPSGSWKPLTDK